MKKCKFTLLRPDKAYVTNNLLLPRKLVMESPVKKALEVAWGETNIIDELGNEVCVQPRTLRLWDENEYHLIVPREFLPNSSWHRFRFEFVDILPTSFEKVAFNDSITLRDSNQETALKAAIENRAGTLHMACGAGKSVIALKIAATLSVPTIVVVNTTSLLEQWKEEIQTHLGVSDVGVVQGDVARWEDKPIVVAMVHTLAGKRGEWSKEFRRRFGVAIYDECFPSGTLVGDKPIETIRTGDLVPSYSEPENKIVYRKVLRTFKKRADTLVKVHSWRGSIVCTPNHPFLVMGASSKAWVKAEDLQNGDMVLTATGERTTWRRVGGVETLAQDGTGLGSIVHNLEVEDTHTYLAGKFVVHNCHHLSAPVFVKCADLFYGRRYSLTATAERLDGLERIYQYHLGQVIHTNLTQQLIPKTTFHRLKWQMPIEDRPKVTIANGEIHISRVRGYLGALRWRNQIIYKDMIDDLTEGRKILALTHSVEHVKLLNDYLSAAGSGMIMGNIDQSDRLSILHGCNPIIATFQLAREGLNKPSLDTLYILTPFSSKNDRQQAWGRIQRKCKGKKEPLVRVYEDTAFSQAIRACQSLRRDLKKHNYPVETKTMTVPEEVIK